MPTNISADYVQNLIKPSLERILKGKGKHFTYENVADLHPKLTRATVGRIFKLFISENTKKILEETFQLPSEKEWQHQFSLAGQAIRNLENNYWLSYRFNSKRQLYISSWIFQVKKSLIKVSKHTPKGYRFDGSFEIDDTLCISGTLYNKNLQLRYQGYIPIHSSIVESGLAPHSLEKEDSLHQFNTLVFSVLVKHGDEIYSTVEVLVKQRDGHIREHNMNLVIEKSNSAIHLIPDVKFLPTNPEYLAYNFLTRFGSRSRTPIADMNPDKVRMLNYDHKIRIACPVRSITTEAEFKKVKIVAEKVYKVLLDKFKFQPKDIFFELMEYSSLHDIKQPALYLFERNNSINYTHFMALIPKLKKHAMGIFAEIFYRMGKRYPVTFFYEDAKTLNYVLNNIGTTKVNNMKSISCKFSDIPAMLSKNPENFLSFELH